MPIKRRRKRRVRIHTVAVLYLVAALTASFLWWWHSDWESPKLRQQRDDRNVWVPKDGTFIVDLERDREGKPEFEPPRR